MNASDPINLPDDIDARVAGPEPVTANPIHDAALAVAENYAGPGASIFTGLLDVFADIILDLIGDCFGAGGDAPNMIRLARNRANDAVLLARRATRARLRERYGLLGYRRHNGEAIVEALLTTCAATTPEKVNTLAAWAR